MKKITTLLLKKYRDNPYQLLLFFSLSFSLLALLSAYISQYIFGLEPCILCYYQRKPFFAIIIIALLFLCFRKWQKLAKIGVIICGILLLINAGIAFYHSGVELKIFAGPKNCSSAVDFDKAKDVEELRLLMLATKAVRCDQPQFYLLKLTMANWNFIFCLTLIIAGLWLRKSIKS